METPLPPIHRRKCLVGLFLTKAQILPQCYDWHKCKIDIPSHDNRVGSNDIYWMGELLADRWALTHAECIEHFRLQCTKPRQPIIAHSKDCFRNEAVRHIMRRGELRPGLVVPLMDMPWKMFLLNPDAQPED